jgi:hypothetical protein
MTPILGPIECLTKSYNKLSFSNNRCPFEGVVDGKICWGFISTTGDTIVQPKYDHVNEFSEGLAWCCMIDSANHRRYECIDTTGQVVISTVEGMNISWVESDEIDGTFKDFYDGKSLVEMDIPGSYKTVKAWIDRQGRVLVKSK